ncbi:hypothetical protein MUK42_34318 [Musa troglodytarum]|uniref:Uncharacterized protein n=1 Tax=Musa troglodytarum TaxID=320322 RepID=A0A9E7EGG1_9LILI|nr:hypothetical protein MUK42_34318 [Musa troglodytarum]
MFPLLLISICSFFFCSSLFSCLFPSILYDFLLKVFSFYYLEIWMSFWISHIFFIKCSVLSWFVIELCVSSLFFCEFVVAWRVWFWVYYNTRIFTLIVDHNCWKDVRSNNMPWVSSLPIHYNSNKRVCLVVFSRVIVLNFDSWFLLSNYHKIYVALLVIMYIELDLKRYCTVEEVGGIIMNVRIIAFYQLMLFVRF